MCEVHPPKRTLVEQALDRLQSEVFAWWVYHNICERTRKEKSPVQQQPHRGFLYSVEHRHKIFKSFLECFPWTGNVDALEPAATGTKDWAVVEP